MSEIKSESACDGIKLTSKSENNKDEEEETLLDKHPSVATSITTTAIVSPTSPVVSPKKMPQNCESAIRFRKAYKHYGRRASRRVPVLVGLDMTIPRGAIYGLLGPSGCGKTTLLQCIVGKQRLASGTVDVFGGAPGSSLSGVPGPRVGYMPQELALYNEFTIAETLTYFGRVFNLTLEKIRKRTKFLVEFLDLPSENRMVGNLSGGQQRRASLAAALLHEPELLILDEPTVGVDPLLRQCIWTHLLEISRSSQLKTTIVITTHYIEEARQANVVGMMRFGRLLAEEHPDTLLEQYGMNSLEDVFLHLCVGDEAERMDEAEKIHASSAKKKKKDQTTAPNGSIIKSKSGYELKEQQEQMEEGTPLDDLTVKVVKDKEEETNNNSKNKSKKSGDLCSFLTVHRLTALLMKNFIRMWRNIGFLIFQFIIPTVQVALFCLAIGRDPRGMTVAIVNEDVGPSMVCLPGNLSYTEGCILGSKKELLGEDVFDFSDEHKKNLSCRFMSHLDPEIIAPAYYTDLDVALESVRLGRHWGALHFASNYTDALYSRLFAMVQMEVPSEDQLDSGEVHVYLDMTNQQVGYTIQLRLAEAYQAFSQSLLRSCDLPERLASLPVSFEEPIYGSNEPTFTEFMAPGVILSITYFMAVGLTALSFIIERKEGLLDRSWVAGVTATEVMMAHVVAQFVVMVVQVALVLVFMIYVFEVPAEGPLTWVVILTLLQGTCGMAFGLVISALCDNEQDAIQLALGSFYPNLLLSGIIWPLEGMPQQLRYLSYALPQTYACEAMRGILSRGWGLEWPQVWIGYGVTLAWTVVLMFLSAVILRIRR